MPDEMSVAANQLPYECFHGSDWEASVLARLQGASHEPGVRGIYLLVAAPHGYEFQHLVVCRDEGDAEGALWTNLTGEKRVSPIHFPHPPARSLDRLQGEWKKRGVSIGSKRDPTRGRNVTLFIVAGGQGAWLTCQTPLKDATQEDDLDALILALQRAQDSRAEQSSGLPQ